MEGEERGERIEAVSITIKREYRWGGPGARKGRVTGIGAAPITIATMEEGYR